MSRYETITSLGDDFLKLINAGIVSVHLLDWKVCYEAYLQYMEKEKHSEAINLVAAHFDVSRRQTERIIAYMKGC